MLAVDRKEVPVSQSSTAEGATNAAADPVVDLISDDEDAVESATESEKVEAHVEERRDSNSSSSLPAASQSTDSEKGTNGSTLAAEEIPNTIV